MPVISFVSTKGGAGKTTAALVAASVISDAAATVSLLDADPNQPLARWAQGATLPENLKVVGNLSQNNILDAIETEAMHRQFVLVDTEGSANLALSYAMSQSHLVVVPVQGSHLDADEAARTIKLVKELRKTTRAAIDCVVVWQRANAALEPGTAKAIRKQFEENRIPVLETKLPVEREAYKAMFAYGTTLQGLTEKQAPNLAKARDNAGAFVEEIITRIKEASNARAA